MLTVSLCACTGIEDAGSLSSDAAETEGRNETEVDKTNRKIIAKALGVFTWSGCMKYLLSCLETIEAGQIQAAELTENNGDRYLEITAQNNKRYRIYLSKNNGVQGVKDLDSGEWPIKLFK